MSKDDWFQVLPLDGDAERSKVNFTDIILLKKRLSHRYILFITLVMSIYI